MNQFNSSVFTPFANTVNNTDDLYKILDELATVERSLFKDKQGTIATKAKDFLASRLLDIFAEIEKGGMIPQEDKRQLAFLKELVEYLKNLPQVKVTLAFSPTNTFVAHLNGTISNLAGLKVVLDIVIDQYIMGGAVFEYRGKMMSDVLSERLDSIINQLIEKNTEEVVNLMREKQKKEAN